MTYGITPQGFVAPSITEVVAEIDADLLATISPTLDLSASSPLGQLRATMAKREVLVWEAVAVAYNAFDRSAAEGKLLDNLGILTGTLRRSPKQSKVTCNLTLQANKTVPAGKIISVTGSDPPVRFVLTTDVSSTLAGDYPGVFVSENTGPIVANAGTLTTIVTTVSGWTAVTNPSDAELGNDLESEEDYRVRQQNELAAEGSSGIDAIRADVLKVKGVIDCRVFENTTNVTNADGMPGKSVEVVVWDGVSPQALNQDIANAMWATKPGGMEFWGGTANTASANVTASDGELYEVKFRRATQVNIYMTVYVASNTDYAGDLAVKTSIVKDGAALGLGEDVIALRFRADPLTVAGVTDVTVLYLNTYPSPSTTANFPIDTRSIALFDTSRVTVTPA